MVVTGECSSELAEVGLMRLPAVLHDIIFNKLHTDLASDQSAFVALRSCCKQLTATANDVLASISFSTAELLRVKPFIGKLSCIKKVAVYCTFASDFSPSLLFLSAQTTCSHLTHLSLNGHDPAQSHRQAGYRNAINLYEVSLSWCCNLTHLEISNCSCTVTHVQTDLNDTGNSSRSNNENGHSGSGSGNSTSSGRRITTYVRWSSFLSTYCPLLESLELRNVTPRLTAPNLRWLRGLKWLTCVGSMDEQDLDLGGWEVLEHLDCSHNRILVLNVSSCFALQTLDCSGNDLQHLFVDACTGLRVLRSSQNNTADLNLSTCISLQRLDCSNSNMSMLCLPFQANLLRLDCSFNSLMVLDLCKNAGLSFLNCSWNKLSELHLEGSSSKLTRLNCSHNALGSLTPLTCEGPDAQQRLESCVALQILDCSHNHLRVLNMASSSALLHLDCSYNTIAWLTLSANRNLQFLACSENSIKGLDIPRTPSLQHVDCAKNRICLLDLSHNTHLLHLNCQKNQLKRLVLGACARLQSISCSFNMLQEMDSHLVQLCKSLPQHKNYNT